LLILAIVENMSVHICSNCGCPELVFGQGGGKKMCAENGVDFLGVTVDDADPGAGRLSNAYRCRTV
jgi:Mrp family chromosome partitioning ATPase